MIAYVDPGTDGFWYVWSRDSDPGYRGYHGRYQTPDDAQAACAAVQDLLDECALLRAQRDRVTDALAHERASRVVEFRAIKPWPLT
jgi:hypothetical protein